MFKVEWNRLYLSYQCCIGERWSDICVFVELIFTFWNKTKQSKWKLRFKLFIYCVNILWKWANHFLTWRQWVDWRLVTTSYGPGTWCMSGWLFFTHLGGGAHTGQRLRRPLSRVRMAERGQAVGVDDWAELRATRADNESLTKEQYREGDFFSAECIRAIWFASSEVIPLILQEEGSQLLLIIGWNCLVSVVIIVQYLQH